jgi:ring-1,2-phenylacetyl-CoA epoxidase subunit PaaE
VKHETRDAIAVTFEVPPQLQDAFQYQQGQHLTLRAMIDGEDVRRSYSICSAVQDNRLRVAIKRVNGGLFSTWANECIRPGVTIDVMPPEGRFNLPLEPESSRHYLAFAAAAASRLSSRSSRPPCSPSRTAASRCCTGTARPRP